MQHIFLSKKYVQGKKSMVMLHNTKEDEWKKLHFLN